MFKGYRLAGLIPGSLALILADYISWQSVFVVVALFMLVGIGMTLVIREAITNPSPPRTMREAIVEPFNEFIGRKGIKSAALVLAFLFLYKFGDNLATALQTPFYIDVGFSLTQIGAIAKFASLVAVIVGGVVGGLVMVKLSINRALWIFGFVQIFSILGFALLSRSWSESLVAGNCCVSRIFGGVGLGAAAVTAFIAKNTNPIFAATQIALFTALASVPRTMANAVYWRYC